jgi:light-regulated signal transduction histidine kinase (bacteriophytochrome)
MLAPTVSFAPAPPGTEAEVLRLQAALQHCQEELEEISGDMENFTYSLTHDLEAPLLQISGFSELLVQSVGQSGWNDASSRHLTRIVDCAGQMRRMLEELRLLSWSGRVEPLLHRQNVARIVEQVVAEVQAEWPGREMRWEIGPLDDVEADEFLLQQIWLKLLQNAAKFTAKKDVAEIQISMAAGPEGCVTFRVADNGVGFDPEFSERIFLAFHRLHGSKEYPGLGMGLAIVRRIVRRQGGTAWAVGRPGEGAEFYVSLPRTGAAA